MEAELVAVIKKGTQISKRLDCIENKFTKLETKLSELDKKI